MIQFYALSTFSRPGLHLWAPGTTLREFLAPIDPNPSEEGWYRFEASIDPSVTNRVGFKLYQRDELGQASDWEKHEREISCPVGGAFPVKVWLFQDAGRVLLEDPMLSSTSEVRIHLITARRYINGQLYIWNTFDNTSEKILLPPSERDKPDPCWNVSLNGRNRHHFHFKFLRIVDGGEEFEPDYANPAL